MYLRGNTNRDFSEHLYIKKYAPDSLDDFQGNQGVVQTVSSFLETKNIPNMIIAGPHGTGKSLLVKLLARSYLGDNLKKGLLEIYGSLSRGKDVVSEKQSVKNKQKNFNCDNITDFMKRTTTMPPDMLKLVIIYEFHQMSTEAQMALRRIIELNSGRVRFIFVTQDYSQIIQALQSRCTILKLQKLDEAEIEKIIRYICDQEKIPFSQELFDLILLNADGDIRCAVNLLQILGKTEESKLYEILGMPEIKVIKNIIQLCIERKGRDACVQVGRLLHSGFDISDLLDIITKVLIEFPEFANKNNFLRVLCKDTFIIQEAYTETQFYNMINHLANAS